MFFKWLELSKGGVDDIGHELADSSDNAVSVAMAHWNVEHRVFAVEQIFRNSDSTVTVQHLFHRKVNVEHQGAILPDRNTILRWVEAFRTTGSVMKRKPPGLPCPVQTPENDTVRRAVVASPRCSARH